MIIWKFTKSFDNYQVGDTLDPDTPADLFRWLLDRGYLQAVTEVTE